MTAEIPVPLPTTAATSADLARIAAELDALIERVRRAEKDHAAALADCTPALRDSARNLVHYLALRQVDLRPLQAALRAQGLSSLGRLESCVLRTLLTVRNALHGLCGEALQPIGDAVPCFTAGDAALGIRREQLFGPRREGRDASIMVTMPSSAASDPGLFQALADAGMDVVRINAAHDGPDAWRAMLEHARAVARTDGHHLRVSIDLAGPKLRTGRRRRPSACSS